MDAPFGALDAQTRTVMQEGRMRICSASRRTMLFITHAVEEAVYLSDRVIVMGRNGGEIVADIDIRNTRQFEDWTAHKRIEDVKDLVSFMELPDPHLQTPPGTGFGFLTGAKAALRRVGAEVIDQAVAVNRKRVGRLMRVNGVRGIGRRRGFTVTTQCNGNDSKAPDLVRRKFDADGPNQLWVADMICVPTWAGLHLPGRGAGRVQPGGWATPTTTQWPRASSRVSSARRSTAKPSARGSRLQSEGPRVPRSSAPTCATRAHRAGVKAECRGARLRSSRLVPCRHRGSMRFSERLIAFVEAALGSIDRRRP